MSNKFICLLIFINCICLSDSSKLDNKTNFIPKKKIHRTDNSFVENDMYILQNCISSCSSDDNLSGYIINNKKCKLVKNKILKLKNNDNEITYYNEFYHDF